MNRKNRLVGKYQRTRITIIRQAKSQAMDRYSLGGREKHVTRPVPSLPKLRCLEREEQFAD
jgi:hypothetical protein